MIKNNTLLFYLLCASLCGLHAPLYATAYKWIDANGQTQYSQTPPAQKDVIIINAPPKASSTAEKEIETANNLQKQLQKQDDDAVAAKEKEKKSQAEAKLKAINCERAKTHLTNMESKVRVRLTDAAGNTTQLTPLQREEDIQRTKERIKENCPP